MSYRTAYDQHLGGSGDLEQRVMLSMCKQAKVVYDESAATPGHAERAAFAVEALNNPEAYAHRFTVSIASIDGNVTDGSLDTTIAGLWSALSGAVTT